METKADRELAITGEAEASPEAVDITAAVAAWEAEQQRRYTALRQQARAAYRAMAGWQTVTSDEDWLALCDEARTDYRSGRFLIERLGAERFLDPPLMASLWGLRQQLIEELGAGSAHELMLFDVAVMSYFHVLRFNGWIGNLALQVEREFFGQELLSVRFAKEYGRTPPSGCVFRTPSSAWANRYCR